MHVAPLGGIDCETEQMVGPAEWFPHRPFPASGTIPGDPFPAAVTDREGSA